MIKGVHHFGIEVDNLETNVNFYKKLGYKVAYEFEIESIGANAAMLMKNGTGIELFEFKDETNELAQKIKKHSALETDDIEADLQLFLDNGYELAMPIDKGRIMKKFAYVKDKRGNYIELCEPQ